MLFRNECLGGKIWHFTNKKILKTTYVEVAIKMKANFSEKIK